MTRTEPNVAKLPGDRNKPLVYISYLEMAPWNWVIPEIEQYGIFKMIGTRLLQRAVTQSLEEGFGGRVGLHSLLQAESFYSKHGMTRLGIEEGGEQLSYFEFSRDAAEKFLRAC